MANTSPDIQPTPLIPHQPKEVHSQHVANRHDEHKQTTRRDAEPSVQDAEIGADDGERDDDFEHEEEALGEGVEDGNEAVDGVEGEGGEGGDVAGGEEGGLEEVEGEEGDAGVGEGEGAVWVGGVGGGGVQLRGEGGEEVGEGFWREGCFWRGGGRGGGVVVDVVFEAHPGDEGGAEGEVEEAFVGDG